ncbi:MAG: helicase-related protein [Alphaproteobacteria bacterium]|jgi:ATP-dependent RNA helicase SUPV3L1/SUV3|nr:helicase-related protein [Alphaproteobacteria bacterium]MDP6565894.1 helicase-related protein [Alphaproteobacteria bacterium]MDP6813718.1 helicase-related protein [Alphaproteobacteria bacterium]
MSIDRGPGGPPANGRVTAVLGPTNTGKTHLAVERMLGHRTGIIGLPLRLLAREIYDRVAAQKGARAVALVTGEEKIVPARPSYFVCTVEAMPLTWRADFLAVDEIQICADPERGHVFTDRLLHARGERETMFLGSDTMKPIIRRLLPDTDFIERPRFSVLQYAGEKKISRLPRRSAIVAFSAAEVYALAELIRRQRGGAAVVMGALSPRTRNAQVALYQSGEVDYLVATDAIGMGLNMDVDHVAFAAQRKFDGLWHRPLQPAEIGQIAGRAGRHMNDGSFGITAGAGALPEEIVEMVENHRFDPVRRLQWRNSDLDFQSLTALRHSLRRRAPRDGLISARDADDVTALEALAGEAEISDAVTGPAMVRRLWEICRIPDFAKATPEAHHRLLSRLFHFLKTDDGALSDDWIEGHMQRLDRTDGDIDTLAGRIAHVRTWTYVSHRAEWLENPRHWQERTRAVEDALSDALHAALTQRFVDRRTAALYRGLKERRDLFGAVTADGEVLVEGHYVGRLRGLKFHPDAAASGVEGRALRSAANQVLTREISRRAAKLATAEDSDFDWQDDNQLHWAGAAVARLTAGPDVLTPRVELLPADHLDGPLRERARRRLQGWLEGRIGAELSPLVRLSNGRFEGAARGLVYQLTEGLGVMPRSQVDGLIADLQPADRAGLHRFGVRLGYLDIYLPPLLRPGRMTIRARLWRIAHPASGQAPLPEPGQVAMAAPEQPAARTFLATCGFRTIGDQAIRIDILDRLARLAHQASKGGPFQASHEMQSLLGRGREALDLVLTALGYRGDGDGEGRRYRYQRVGSKKRRQRERPTARHSAFAELRRLNRSK